MQSRQLTLNCIRCALIRRYAEQIVSLQLTSKFQFAPYSFLSLRAPVIATKNKSKLVQAYLLKGVFGQINQVWAEVELEKKRLFAIVVYASQQSSDLDRKLALLEQAKKVRYQTEAVVRVELAKNEYREKTI